MESAVTIGLDLGKSVFQVHRVDACRRCMARYGGNILIRQAVLSALCLAGCTGDSHPSGPMLATDIIRTEADAVLAAKRSCSGRYSYNPSQHLKWSASLSGSLAPSVQVTEVGSCWSLAL
jgi:hypothetical protein